MKITVHEVECYVGYARPLFRGLDAMVIDAEVAKTCRRDWNNRNWLPYWEARLESREDPPPMPQSDQEVIQTFFYGPSNECDDGSEYRINRATYELDLSAPSGFWVDLSVDGNFQVIRHDPQGQKGNQGGAHSVGVLIRDTGVVGDALEGFILALAAAGFPVHTPEFKACLVDYCHNLVNHMDDNDAYEPSMEVNNQLPETNH